LRLKAALVKRFRDDDLNPVAFYGAIAYELRELMFSELHVQMGKHEFFNALVFSQANYFLNTCVTFFGVFITQCLVNQEARASVELFLQDFAIATIAHRVLVVFNANSQISHFRVIGGHKREF